MELYFHSPVCLYEPPAAKPVAKDEHGAVGFQCRFIHLYIGLYVHMIPCYTYNVYIYIYIYVYVHTHTHTHTRHFQKCVYMHMFCALLQSTYN